MCEKGEADESCVSVLPSGHLLGELRGGYVVVMDGGWCWVMFGSAGWGWGDVSQRRRWCDVRRAAGRGAQGKG